MRARFSRLVAFHIRLQSASVERQLGRLHRPDRPVVRDHRRLRRRDDHRLGGRSPAPAHGGAKPRTRVSDGDQLRRTRPRPDRLGFSGPGASSATAVPAGELALAGRDDRQRVGAEQRGDDVGSLGPVGHRHRPPVAARSRRTRTACSRSGLRGTSTPSTASGSSVGVRGCALKRWPAPARRTART